jgi:hypothetical protein
MIPVLTGDRACSGAAKYRTSVRQRSEVVSKVLGSSRVSVMNEKN